MSVENSFNVADTPLSTPSPDLFPKVPLPNAATKFCEVDDSEDLSFDPEDGTPKKFLYACGGRRKRERENGGEEERERVMREGR